MIKQSRRRKYDRCTCHAVALGRYCMKCDAAVCQDCAATHISQHRAVDKQAALSR